MRTDETRWIGHLLTCNSSNLYFTLCRFDFQLSGELFEVQRQMSKINQIQTELRGLDQAAFQKLADLYLYKEKGHERINPLGSVIGADKVRRGTPDTLISLPNGKYIFAEHTTQQEGLYGKIRADLEKCFDEARTGISVGQIEEVVFCHTSLLNADEENHLAEECRKHKVNLSIYGIGPISYGLYQKYHGLARDCLGIEVDTGQIVAPDEFVTLYNKDKLATRLDTTFHYREEEIARALQGLEMGDLVIISGRPGIGKSRLALECCTKYKVLNGEYRIRCIYNRGPDLFEDLRVYFSESGSFLILVDDANRISRFDYIIQLLQGQRNDQKIKVIATVRDYAVDSVMDTAKHIGVPTTIELSTFDEKQIKQLIEDEYNIHNPVYQEKIVRIARGNPRLAIMASEIAVRENTLQSIQDVSSLYDEYFASIRRDLADLGQRNLLNVAGVVAFFRTVDRSNKPMMLAIKEAFDISPEEFWEMAIRLHDIEVFDLYENEVVRISDQVLATYLFYLAFFKEQSLDFSALLMNFFPQLKSRLIDVINPVLDTFDVQTVERAMQPYVDKVWQLILGVGDEERLLHLMEVFWFLKPTDTLISVRERIERIELQLIDLSESSFKTNSNISSHSILHVLSMFQYLDENFFRIAVDLVLEYFSKRTMESPQVMSVFTTNWGFTHRSHFNGYRVQTIVIDSLWRQSQKGDIFPVARLFLAVAKHYLATHFHTLEAKSEAAVTIINFDLTPIPELFSLRQTIWHGLFHLYQIPIYTAIVLDVLQGYCTSGRINSVGEIVAQDAEEITAFIQTKFEPANFRHCLIAQDYFELLERLKVNFDIGLRDAFMSPTYRLSEVILTDRRDSYELDYDQWQQHKNQQIENYFRDFQLKDYIRFFEQCIEIAAGLDSDHNQYTLRSEVDRVLSNLASQNAGLYIDAVRYYVEAGDPLKLSSGVLTDRLIAVCAGERAYEILSSPTYPTKRIWLFSYYRSLPSANVTIKHLHELYVLYEQAELGEVFGSLDYLLKYRSLDEEVVIRIVRTLLEKASREPRYAYALEELFNPHSNTNQMLMELFAANLDLLKSAYFAVARIDAHADYNRSTLARILDVDSGFIIEYIQRLHVDEDRNLYDDIRDYTFIWARADHEELMTRVVWQIFEWEQTTDSYLRSCLDGFFKPDGRKEDNPEVLKRQNELLAQLIEQHCEDSDFMKFIFDTISDFSPDRRTQFVALFLQHNTDFDSFRRLSLEPLSHSWSGSAVPMFQDRVDYLSTLLPFMSTVDLLQHRQYVEHQIEHIRSSIEREKKEEFMHD
jgi:hypothetical protein